MWAAGCFILTSSEVCTMALQHPKLIPAILCTSYRFVSITSVLVLAESRIGKVSRGRSETYRTRALDKCEAITSIMKPVWTRLIRFVATDGRTLYGEPIVPSADYDLGIKGEKEGIKAKVIQGPIYGTSNETKVTDEIVDVEKLLGPLSQSDVPIIRAIGLK